jgi:hypothetical protein
MDRTITSIVCIALVVFASQSGYSETQAGGEALSLRIDTLSGEGAVNYLKSRTSREVIVQVTDENHKPVAGAVVVFALPEQGASGAFVDGSTMLTTTTDADGKAVASGLRANSVKGNYNIQVRASFNSRSGSTSISQTNAEVAVAAATGAAISAKVIAIIAAAAAAGVAGGVVAATRSGTKSPGAVVSTGTVSFGPPGTP